MVKFYTVDRSGEVNESDKFELITDFSQSKYLELPDLFSQEDNVKCINEYFPNGISRHGQIYLFGYPSFARRTQNNNLIPSVEMIEAIFELVRRKDFPELPSRMTSMFAWQTINEAKVFADSYPQGSYKILEVESDNVFIGDMSLLTLGGQVINSYVLAKKYWSGERSPSPKLEVLISLPVIIGKEVL